MQSRRDQVQSYQFFMHRVISALVARESDPAELPFRRLGGAAFGSVMVAVLALAAAGVYGLLVGGGATSWRDGNSVIVEKETAAAYVFRDGRLHPVVNVLSARLVLDRFAPVRRVSAKSLLGVPRGPELGMPGTPAGLPTRDRLLTGAWSLCSRMVADGRGGRVATSVLAVGRDPVGGTPLADERAVLVRDEALHLVWNDHRYALGDSEAVLLALGVGPDQALDVATEWLDALPPGEPLRPVAVDERGRATDAFGDRRADVVVGQVVEAANAYYLVERAELRPITPLQKDIVLADPAYPDGPSEPIALSPAALASATMAKTDGRTPTAPPERTPVIVSPSPTDRQDGAVCASFGPDRFAPRVIAGARLPGPGTPTPQSAGGALLADEVLVAPGRAALVSALSSPDAPGGTLHVVTDQGIRYALAGAQTAPVLGYDANRAVRLPASLLSRLPAGPALDPATARAPTAR